MGGWNNHEFLATPDEPSAALGLGHTVQADTNPWRGVLHNSPPCGVHGLVKGYFRVFCTMVEYTWMAIAPMRRFQVLLKILLLFGFPNQWSGCYLQVRYPECPPPPPAAPLHRPEECLITVTVAGGTDSKLYAGTCGADQVTHLPIVS